MIWWEYPDRPLQRRDTTMLSRPSFCLWPEDEVWFNSHPLDLLTLLNDLALKVDINVWAWFHWPVNGGVFQLIKLNSGPPDDTDHDAYDLEDALVYFSFNGRCDVP